MINNRIEPIKISELSGIALALYRIREHQTRGTVTINGKAYSVRHKDGDDE